MDEPTPMLTDLPREMLTRMISLLDTADIGRLDCVSKFFHMAPPPPPSLIEEALQMRAAATGRTIMAAAQKRPGQSWTQALLMSEVRSKPRARAAVSGAQAHTAFVSRDGGMFVVGSDIGLPNEEGVWPDDERYFAGMYSGDEDDSDYEEEHRAEDAAPGVLGLGAAVHRSAEPTPISFPAGTPRIVAVSCSDSMTLALDADGRAYSWGSGGLGLGHGDEFEFEREQYAVYTPKRIETYICDAPNPILGLFGVDEPLISISAGSTSCWAVGNDGGSYSWGYNHDGILGHGPLGDQAWPRIVAEYVMTPSYPTGTPIVAAAAGSFHSLAINGHGSLFSCGRGDYLGLGSSENRDLMTHVSSVAHEVVVQVANGGEVSAVVTAGGAVYTWGLDDEGLGYDGGTGGLGADSPYVLLPRRVSDLSGQRVWSIATNGLFTLCLCEGGAVYSWGHRWGGKLGDGDGGPSGNGGPSDGRSNSVYPRQVLRQLGAVREVCVSGSKGLAVASDGRVFGWGIADGDAILLEGARRDRYAGPTGPRTRVKVWQPDPKRYGWYPPDVARGLSSVEARHNRRALRVLRHVIPM